ncbi:T9SS type A sorting domain-containing protein [Sabulibacter ruber]|uniref:T9SS type A sorting domain-containing protein n=1 Tax=Sabulibacter ruber TaxID=2811901 RepID=UPI001A9585DE|nr:T9SS type A sorting domain-containing protein [Sabulibacter ruber]
MVLEYSFNGGVWVPVEKWFDVGTAWSKVNAELDISLPACFNKGKVKLRWTYVVSNGTSAYAIDDITITGIPYGGPSNSSAKSTFSWEDRTGGEIPYNVARYGSTNYYELDGVKMQWDKLQSGNANMYTQQVTPDYQSIDTYSISQQFAGAPTSTNFTKTTLHFINKSVTGLTFTLFDVDQSNNQFLDILKVVAYKNGISTPILPKKQQVQTTSTNDFVQEGTEVFFKSKTQSAGGANIDGSSPEGDVVVTFLEAIDRLEISFYNGTPPQNGKGQQGFAISDLYWRNVNMSTPETDFITQSAIGGTDVGPDPLPVTLTAFDVKKVAEGAKLDWITAAEIDNDRFVVERSQDGKTFEAIGEVKGAGNSNVLLKYSFIDKAPKHGINYYRLTQYDYDGTSETSKMVYLSVRVVPAVKANLTAYPNPTSEDLTIKTTAASANEQIIYILNSVGSVVKTVVLPKHETSAQFSVRELASGLYLVKTGKATTRFYKQ